ncbi:MAG TPA: M20/M25/M40 family metallo-hydrolase [Candidatus Methanoperedens sp.]|nr:M20/M25/M40 family metallo-hydrolase [Candidatus Methanoperedens sp.]
MASFLLFGWIPAARAQVPLHHDISVSLEPAAHTLAVRDRMTFPAPPSGAVVVRLHPGLNPVVEESGARLEEAGGDAGVARYRLTLPAGAAAATFVYRGVIDHPLEQVGEEYARGQKETRGTISEAGVFLTGDSGWFPAPEDGGTLTFALTVDLPEGWDGVSQGSRTTHEVAAGRRRVRWECSVPQDDLALVADRYTEYRERAGDVEAMVFLREPDEALARQYLAATAGYLDLYAKLIGPYPYGTWSTVENFWETGYGMPSFTLLGPKVIRFPFILHSSFPHEILHSWWGNGVFVDYDAGNWAEGLTAYLADHLDKEQRGEGAEHRRVTLQKYADFVLAGRDLPLTAFRSRHGSVTEAVGYGKTMMLFHMLRLEIGDALFIESLRTLWREKRFATASFGEVRAAFEKGAGKDLAWFFAQWVERTGAPQLRVRAARAGGPAGRDLTVVLEQTQEGEPYRLRVPFAVTIEGLPQAIAAVVEMTGRTAETTLANLPGRPLRVDVDPEFDLFRRLDMLETPPAFSRAFGAEQALILLPSAAPALLLEGYRTLAGLLERSGPGRTETREDRELTELPRDRAVFVLGWENRFFPAARDAATALGAVFGEGEVRLEQTPLARRGNAFALSARHPADPALTLSFAALDDPAAAEGLGRKLPHYGRYGFLAFEGAEPANIAKGRWSATDSPLARVLVAGEPPAATGRFAARTPLAALPPRFSAERMLADVRVLADPALCGRGFAAAELERAAEIVAAAFAAAGLQPGGDAGTWFQTFTATGGAPLREATLRNVVGVLPGTRADLPQDLLVLGAHYDHLGLGDPGCLPENRGRVHPGADDNASGVAVLLELARTLWREARPARTVVFAAFAAEEQGRLGSAHFISRREYRPERTFAMVNLDTVGRLEGRKVLVLGGSSAREWVHIFRGAGYLAGVETALAAGDIDASDDVTWRSAGVPAVQLFGGPSPDYHRPGDTPERIDGAGLVRVAALAAEVSTHLAGAETRLTASDAPAPQPGAAGEGERKVSLGVVPDFAFSGPGVRLEGVVPGSPAEAAGLRAGDILLAIGNTELAGLKALSAQLKALQPGKVALRYARGGAEATVDAQLLAR